MASSIQTLTPNGSDADGSGDWTLQSGLIGDTLHEALSTDSSLRYIQSTSAVSNTFEFTNITTDNHLDVQWIQYEIKYKCTIASTNFQTRFIFKDGGDSDSTITGISSGAITSMCPNHVSKSSTYTSGIYPYTTGTTAMTETQLNNLKLQLYLLDADSDGSNGNQVQIHTLKIYAMMNDTDSATISTYPAKKGMKVSRGTIRVG